MNWLDLYIIFHFGLCVTATIMIVWFQETPLHSSKQLLLDIDGICRVNSKEDAIQRLPVGYNMIPYAYHVRGDGVSTFHRDVTSSPYEFQTKHPVYTLIHYKFEGNHLSACLGSHLQTPFLWNPPSVVKGDTDDYYLFHCDLIHAGALNIIGNKREIIQYKICHQDDLEKLSHLNGIQVSKQYKTQESGWFLHVKRYLSLFFSYYINHIFTPLLQNNHSFVHYVQPFIGNIYYNKDS